MTLKHVETLLQAVNKVSPELVSNSNFVDDEKKIEFMNERTFAYELYRQWQDLIEVGHNNLVINAEIEKKCGTEQKFVAKLEEIFGLTKEGKPHRFFYPDLVCHNSQYTSDKPEVICEIKTKKGIEDKDHTKILHDFKKLSAYMTDGVLLYNPFKIGVFILVGGSFSDIKFKSEDFIENKKDNIFCLLYNVKKDNDGKYMPDVQWKCLKELNYDEKQQ